LRLGIARRVCLIGADGIAAAAAKLAFNAPTEILAITKGPTVIDLGFNSAFTGEHFLLSANGVPKILKLRTPRSRAIWPNALTDSKASFDT
jgi:hypothetical protein